MLATMDPRAHHQAIARAVRLRARGRGRARQPRTIAQVDPFDASLPPRGPGKAQILPIEPTRPLADVISEVRAALELATRAVVCTTCDRRLCRPDRGARPTVLFNNGEPLLADEDWCRWCARPISERGEQLAPKDGFLKLVREVAARAPAESIASHEAAL